MKSDPLNVESICDPKDLKEEEDILDASDNTEAWLLLEFWSQLLLPMWLFEVSLLGVIFGAISLKSESSNRTCFRSSLEDVEDALTQNNSCFTFRIDEKLILLCK